MCWLVARIVVVLLVLVIPSRQRASGADSPAGVELFETRIRPVLVESCFECHSADADQIEGELTLDNRANVLRGGRSGAVIVPGDPDASRLLQALQYKDAELQMPPGEKLSDEVIADFKRWIKLGCA